MNQNQEEAKEWLKFLCEHTDKEELKTLEDEIANRFVFKFDVEIDTGELDGRRVSLMKEYLIKSNEKMKEHPEQLPRRLVQELDACYVVVDEWDDFVEATKLKAVLLAPILSGALSSGIRFILTANSGKLKGFDEITKFAKATTDGLLVGNPGSTGIFGTVAAKELPQLSDGLLFHNGAYVRIRIPKCEDREE